MPRPLTQRQTEVLTCIRRAVHARGLPPTQRELCAELGVRHISALQKHLKALEEKGHIRRIAGGARSIVLCEGAGIPIIGRVAAGAPIHAIEHVEAYVDIAQGLFKTRPDYLLRVRGLSMRDAGILPDDLIGVLRQAEARSGQIVVARIEDEVTVKELRIDGNDALLVPRNPGYETLRVPGERLVIEGVYVGLVRGA